MARRSTSLGGLRPLALAVVVATSLLAPVGISAQAAEEDVPTETAPTSDPIVPTPDPGGTAPDPVTSSASAPTGSPPSNPPPTAVTVSRAGASASKSVSIVDFAFNPGSITVNTGDTVQWTNNGKVSEGHDVTGDGLDSGLMISGDTYNHTFKASGTFSYLCTIHPSMTGTVKVLGRSSGDSGGSGESGDGGGSSGSDTTAAGSESAALTPPVAAGTDTSLPASGDDSLPLATLGIWLLALGLAIRVFAAGVLRRRS